MKSMKQIASAIALAIFLATFASGCESDNVWWECSCTPAYSIDWGCSSGYSDDPQGWVENDTEDLCAAHVGTGCSCVCIRHTGSCP